jgi:hypothetical protein
VADPLEFPNGALRTGVEFAFGASPESDPNTWTWTDASSDHIVEIVSVSRGRQNEQALISPTSADLTLDNATGDYTPNLVTGAHYPNVDLGTPARFWAETPDPRLALTASLGTRARVASTSAIDITGDLDVRIELSIGARPSSAGEIIPVGRYDPTPGSRSWQLGFFYGVFPALTWSADGTAINFIVCPLPAMPVSQRTVFRTTLDVDNGAGGWTVNFYLAESMDGPWEQISDPITGTGVTSIYNAPVPLDVGSAIGQNEENVLRGSVYRLQVRDGIDGTLVVDTDFTAQTPGVTSFVDDTGLTWDLQGLAEISRRWYRILGTTDTWTPQWPWGDLSSQQPGGIGSGEARTGVSIAGVLRRLGQGASPLQSPIYRAITATSQAQAYWPMEDLRDSQQIASALPGGSPMSVEGEVAFAQGEGLTGSKQVLEFPTPARLVGAVGGTFVSSYQVSWYMYLPTPPVDSVMMRIYTSGSIATWALTTGNVNVNMSGYDSVGGLVTSAGSSSLNLYDRWVYARLQVEQNGDDVDWEFIWFPVEYPQPTGFFFGATAISEAAGRPITVEVPGDATPTGTRMGHIAVYSAVEIDPRSASHGYQGENAVIRMRRLCDEESVSFQVLGDATPSILVGPQTPDTLLNLLNAAAEADGGILYEQSDGIGLVYRTPDSLYNQRPALVLDGLQRQIANPLQPVLDDAGIRNDVTVTRAGGSSVRVTDEESIEKHGRYTDSVTLSLLDDSQLPEAAGFQLHMGKSLGMRYPSAAVNLGVSPELAQDWVHVDSGSKIEIINLPPQHPSDTVGLIVQGYTEPIGVTRWDPRANCSPAGLWESSEIWADWVQDKYALRADTDGSVLALAVGDSDTSLFVAVTAGPEWVTDPAEFPFDARVGYEQVTVTAISAPGGSSEFVGAGNFSTSSTSSFVAPSVTAADTNDLLICCWQSFDNSGTITPPGGMTGGVTSVGTFSVMRAATQVVAGSGATGTRTATFSVSDAYSAVSVLVHSAGSTPVVQESYAGIDDPVTLSTSANVQEGWWLLAIQGWDFDPANNMPSPDGGGWLPVADSVNASLSTSRTRAWARRVTTPGVQDVLFISSLGVADNHARLFVLSGVTGVTQTFTVVRSVNGLVTGHEASTDVRLWHTPIVGR